MRCPLPSSWLEPWGSLGRKLGREGVAAELGDRPRGSGRLQAQLALELALWLVFGAALGLVVPKNTPFPATPQPLLLGRQQLGPALGSSGR